MNGHLVYIIESSTVEEYNAGIREGAKLVNLLTALNIDNRYNFVRNKCELIDAFRQCIEAITHCETIWIHWSGHGTYNSIVLMSGEECKWGEITELLSAIPCEQRSGVNLCFSSCFGSSSINIGKDHWLPLYNIVVGPNRKISWEEAAYAYQIFYYSIFHIHTAVSDAVKRMNIAISATPRAGHPFIYSTGRLRTSLTALSNPGKYAPAESLKEYCRNFLRFMSFRSR